MCWYVDLVVFFVLCGGSCDCCGVVVLLVVDFGVVRCGVRLCCVVCCLVAVWCRVVLCARLLLSGGVSSLRSWLCQCCRM